MSIEELGKLEPAIDDEGKVQNATSRKRSLGIVRNVKVNTSADQAQDDSCDPFGVIDVSLSFDELYLSSEALDHLNGEGQGVRVRWRGCLLGFDLVLVALDFRLDQLELV
jgi:hypothetical protein